MGPFLERKAGRLEQRSDELQREAFREWQIGLTVPRDHKGRPLSKAWNPSLPAKSYRFSAQRAADRLERERKGLEPSSRPVRPPAEIGQRLGGSEWHLSRARGAREQTPRVIECLEERRVLKLSCRDCGHQPQLVPIGCGNRWLCDACRKRNADKYRTDFDRLRLGLTTAARRAGLMGRRRRRALGGRFSEKLLTLTLPHEGTATERLALFDRVWPRFWRLVSDWQKPKLSCIDSGASTENGEPLSLWDFVHYVWVKELTPGSDPRRDPHGHPHRHLWFFGPYLERKRLGELWQQAYADVTGRKLELPIIDIRTAHEVERDGSTVSSEIVKYLTKDWAVSADGVQQMPVEIYAQVIIASDGKRQRQSSSGLRRFAVEKVCFCPACGYENERGHWAFIQPVHVLQGVAQRPADPTSTGPPAAAKLAREGPSNGADSELRMRYLAQRDREWIDSVELRVLRARFAVACPELRKEKPR